ncbi:hypothetical protein KFE98_03125 [bacterium SCSIO 12741]|nr:hypothetical protein KFE98_03125 [bacterium SCSIO 12741]
MNSRIQSLIAFGFSFLLVFSAIPFTGLHDHEEEHDHHCHIDHGDQEEDLCHIALYHPDESVGDCNHEAHYSAEELECEWCQLDLQLLSLYDLDGDQKGLSLEVGESGFSYLSHHPFYTSSNKHIRGPPIC